MSKWEGDMGLEGGENQLQDRTMKIVLIWKDKWIVEVYKICPQ